MTDDTRVQPASALLQGLSWPLIGITALCALAVDPGMPVDTLHSGNWAGALYLFDGQLLNGLTILLLCIVLSNLRRPRLPRWLALTVGVLLGSILARTLFVLPWALGVMDTHGGVTGTPAGDVLWFARKAVVPWGALVAVWYFGERVVERSSALRNAEAAQRQLEVRIVEARLQVLLAQTEPHFLFNTLAHVKRLCRTDPAAGRRMLDRFCDYLRGALPQMRSQSATLGRELDLACAYLDVQGMRMGARLAVDVQIPDALRACAFPPMMLLSLVENAVIHGLSPLAEGGRIVLAASMRGSSLVVSVSDTGQGLAATHGTGVGLSNIRSRLEALHESQARLTLAANLPSGFIASIELPAVTLPPPVSEAANSRAAAVTG